MDKKDLLHATLVPMDFTETSLFALEHAAAIAQISEDNKNKIICLLHVIEGASIEPVYDTSNIANGDRDALAIEGAINRLSGVIQKYQDKFQGITFTPMIAGGKPFKKIARVAEEIEAQSIVMGSHGSSGWQAIAGSNASRVIQIAPCPVIVVKERPLGQGYKNIVLPLDLSKETKQKVNITAKIAKYFDSTVHIVTMAETDEFLERRLKNNLAQVESYFEDRDIKTTSTTLDEDNGNFAMQTLTWAQGKDADLIIIMAQQEKGWSEYIFGSYAQQIVNRSPIPVLTVTPRAELGGVFDIM